MLSDLEIYEINRLSSKNMSQSGTLEYWASAISNNKILSKYKPQRVLNAYLQGKAKDITTKTPTIEAEIDIKTLFTPTGQMPIKNNDEYPPITQENTAHCVIETSKEGRTIKHLVKSPLFNEIAQSCAAITIDKHLTNDQLFEAMKSCNGNANIQNKKWASEHDCKLESLLKTYSFDELKRRATFLEMKSIQ